MPLKAFALFNFMGALVWVTFISGAGYLFGQHWHRLVHFMQRLNIAVLAVAAIAFLYFWWKRRRHPTVFP
jgi:membrane protein DedA with SNARE-associated domain